MIDRISQHTFVRDPLRPSATVLDLGLNRGEFAGGVRERYACRVCAVEANPDLAAAAPLGVETLHGAIAASSGTLTFGRDLEDDTSSSVVDAILDRKPEVALDPIEVPAYSLADVLDRFELEHVELVKMDIEGAELDVLAETPADVLRRAGQIAVEFHDLWYPELRGATRAAIRRMRSIGFDVFSFSRGTSDVLFVNRDRLRLPAWRRLWLRHVLSKAHALGRAARVAHRRLGRS